jgi:chromosome segregation ATPase
MLRSLDIIPFVSAPELFNLIVAFRRSESDLDRQVQEAVDALQKSSSLVTDLEEKLGERAKKLEALQEEYKRVSDLSAISKEQIAALSAHLEQTIDRGRWKDVLIAISIHLAAGIIFFIVGVFLSDPVKSLFVHHHR